MGGWQYIFIISGLVLQVVTYVQQYRRRNKRNLVLRLIASVMAVISLTCLALNITYTRATPAENAAIILTEGYNTDSVNAFKTSHTKMPAYSFDEYIASGLNNYAGLHVFGSGLSADELQQLNNTPVIFHNQPVAMGTISVNWQQTLQTGEQLRIQGSFNNTTNAPVKLQLNGLNTLLDSTTIKPNSLSNFELTATPKQSGRAVYNITALAGDNTIEEEFVPVDVTPADSIKVLILAASPDFENRFLKTWLAENNCEVVVRSTTSKGKFDKSFTNTATTNIDQITTQTLATFDVLISDAAEFASLSRDEQNAVQATVESGMGLIIKTDTTLSSSFYTSLFPVYSGQVKPQQSSTLRLAGGAILTEPAEQSLFIHEQPGTQALVTDSSAQVLVGSTVYGSGKVAVTTLNNTYSWMLTGNKHNYHTYWSALLSRVVKNKNSNQNMCFYPAFARVNQPLHLTFSANTNPYPVINGSPLYLSQQVNLPFKWDGVYWPTQAGWQTIKLQNDSINFYTYTNSDWKQVTAFANTAATNQYVVAQQTISSGSGVALKEEVPVPKVYFVVVLLVGCTFLWVERKFS